LTDHRIIQSDNRKNFAAYIGLVINNRRLIATFVLRDLKIKYAQSVLGIFWTVLQPIIGVLLFTLVINKWLKVGSVGYPYPLFAYCGIICWNFFNYMVTGGGLALSESRDIIKRLSFPRLILPIAKMLVGLLDFTIGIALLLILCLFFGMPFKATLLVMPLFVVVLICTGLGIAFWLSALTIRYRDFNHIIPYIVNFGIWVTPVFYPITVVPEKFRPLIYLNPVAFAVEGMRWAVLPHEFNAGNYFISLVPVVILMVTGIFFFRSVEGKIADTL
jgi:lipopolysaccharide transport system permease protein